jgi:TRAP transporter TAXI family solute receptor
MIVGVVIAAVTVIAIYLVIHTLPPRFIVMATGAQGGAYNEVGKAYQEILGRAGVEVRLVNTAGSFENLAKLRDPASGVSVGLLQGGVTNEQEAPELESLGTLFYEPLWLFVRSELRGAGLEALRGKKVSIGPEGSGTRALALELLKRNGLDQQIGELLALSTQDSSDKLLAGEIDAAVMLVSFDSPVVRRLIADERVEPASFPNTDAYVALYPYLSKVIVPAGVGDLKKNRPSTDVALFAPKASLVVRKDLNSAIKFALLNTALQVHSGAGIFHRAGAFPAPEMTDLPISADAIQFYKSGRPFLQNYLPFWLASLAARLIIILVPLLGVLYPLLKFLPALYGWTMRSKISRLYGELRLLEDEMMMARSTGHDSIDAAARLDRLEQQADHLKLPAAYGNMLYMLRNHIALVRERLKAA